MIEDAQKAKREEIYKKKVEENDARMKHEEDLKRFLEEKEKQKEMALKRI